MAPHNFKRFPELTNSQMQFYYFDSPHRQILEDFWGTVTKITDGDTIHVKWNEREKPIVVRFIGTAAPELNEIGGFESRSWLEKQIMGNYVQIQIDPNLRVEKWGRILGRIFDIGRNINQESIDTGHAITFEEVGSGWA